MRPDSDPALETLLLPLREGRFEWPGTALFLNARAGAPLAHWPAADLHCVQEFKPEADALQRAGHAVLDQAGLADRRFPLVLVLPPRQREQARALMARAVAATAPGGRVLACVANNEGAKSAEADLARLAGPLAQLSKHKCRAFWTAPLHAGDSPARVDDGLVAQWQVLDAPRPVADGRFLSRPGVFAWDRIDPASALLAGHLPADLRGRAADLGAGFGYLSAELLQRAPGIAELDLFEAQHGALELARRNLAGFSGRVAIGYHWHDVTAGLPRRYDVIVSNPPFHGQGRADRPDIGRRFIAVAGQSLRPGGRLLLVANRHLPYESELAVRFGSVRTLAQQGGFKVVEAGAPA